MSQDRTLEVEYRPLAALIPYAKNARTHSDEQVAQIAASIREFGLTNPILVDGDNGIIAGHGRLLAARKLGMATVPVIELAGMSEAQKRAYIIADNKLALNAGWDRELLGLELGDLGSLGFDLSLTGFGEDEIARLTQPRQPRPHRSGRCSRGRGAGGQPAGRCLAARQAPAGLRRQHQSRRCRRLPRRREAAPDGHRSSLWRELRPGLAGAPGHRSPGHSPRAPSSTTTAPTGGRPGPCSPAMSPMSGTAPCSRGRFCESLEAAGFVVRAQIIWDKTRLVIGRGDYHWPPRAGRLRRAQGQDRPLGGRPQPDHGLADPAPQATTAATAPRSRSSA